MSRLLLALSAVVVFGLLTTTAYAQVITFALDFANQDLADMTVGVRGDTAPLSWGHSMVLTDPYDDGIYTIDIAFPDGTARPPMSVSPAPDAFGGKVAVLIDAGPSSATFYLANTIQQTGVGQTTGGSLKGLNAGQVAFLTLPHTGFAVDVPLYGSRPPVPGPDRGVVPDVVVEPDVAALVVGRDPELEAALTLLAE